MNYYRLRLRSHDMDGGAETRTRRSDATAAAATIIADVAYSPVSTASSSSVHGVSKRAPASVALMDDRYPPTK